MPAGGVVPSLRIFALVKFAYAALRVIVQRSSRSLCHTLAGLFFLSSGMRPALIVSFSSRVLRCLGGN